jgi:hypothetical protein
MFDSNFCLSAGVNVRYDLHTFIGLYKNLSWVSLNLVPSLHHHYFLLISSNPILQMANTRNRNANNNNDDENNNAGNPPPTLEQVLVMQAQMLHTMQQTMVNMQQNQQAPQPQQRDRLGNFQRTNMPHFSHSMEPMDADDWLKTVEKKL